MSENTDELHETIAAKGQLEKAISRMVVEKTTAAMAKSLSSFLDRMEAQETARTGRYEAIVKGGISEAIAPLMAEFHDWRAASDIRIAGLEDGQKKMSQLIQAMETRLTAKRDRLVADEQAIDALRTLQQAQQAEIDELRTAIEARPSPEKAHATYEGVERIGRQIAAIMQHLDLSDTTDATDGNG